MFGFMDEEDLEESRFNFKEDRYVVRTAKNKKPSGLGLLTTLLYATMAETVENSQFIIETFRQNSGMSFLQQIITSMLFYQISLIFFMFGVRII